MIEKSEIARRIEAIERRQRRISVVVFILMVMNLVSDYQTAVSKKNLTESYERLTTELREQNALTKHNTDAVKAFAVSVDQLLVIFRDGE